MPNNVPINFVCTEKKLCEAVPPEAHMDRGDKVTLKGNNVDVDIHFLKDSPFKSGTLDIHLTKGVPHPEEVKEDAKHGDYVYTYKCTEPDCPTPTKSNPKMIVP